MEPLMTYKIIILLMVSFYGGAPAPSQEIHPEPFIFMKDCWDFVRNHKVPYHILTCKVVTDER